MLAGSADSALERRIPSVKAWMDRCYGLTLCIGQPPSHGGQFDTEMCSGFTGEEGSPTLRRNMGLG